MPLIDSEIAALAAELGDGSRRAARCARRRNRAPAGSSPAPSPTIAGSSGWFDRGFVTYSNEAKMEMLGVRRRRWRAHGAVSEATARAMAEGALARSRADSRWR